MIVKSNPDDRSAKAGDPPLAMLDAKEMGDLACNIRARGADSSLIG